MTEPSAKKDAAYWMRRYEDVCRNVERMAREPMRVRTPAELRDLTRVTSLERTEP